MGDIDALRKREIPYWSLVDGQGVSVGGTGTLDVLRRRGMESACQVDANGSAVDASTLRQLQARGIQYFCEVTELGVDPVSANTLTVITARGIPAKCPVDVNGIAQSGSATIETLRRRGIAYFCPLDETGTATTLGTLNLSASSFPENSALNTVIGTLSVSGGTGTYTYTFTSNPGTLFNISGSSLRVTSTTIAAGSYPVTIQANNGAGSVITRAFLLTATSLVTNFTAVRMHHLQW